MENNLLLKISNAIGRIMALHSIYYWVDLIREMVIIYNFYEAKVILLPRADPKKGKFNLSKLEVVYCAFSCFIVLRLRSNITKQSYHKIIL